jgi:hypothetical protein
MSTLDEPVDKRIASHATLDQLERNEALDIDAELGEIFSRCAMRSSGFSGGSQGKGIYTIGTLTRVGRRLCFHHPSFA